MNQIQPPIPQETGNQQQPVGQNTPQQQPQSPQEPMWLTAIGKISKWMLLSIIAIIIVVVLIGYFSIRALTKSTAELEVEQTINITPTQIESMKAIGEWEFLSVSDEELVDTLRRGFFSDDELIRIYYGTLRLGINMHKVKPHWISMDKDTLVVTLPPIELLSEDFIDEARTKSFYESGSWSDSDREALFKKAYRHMKERCMNSSNVNSAEQNASKQFYQLMRSMGFEQVRIRFEEQTTASQQSQ